MKHVYAKTVRIKYNNQIYQVLLRDDKKYGFLKIVNEEKTEYAYPTAQEFLRLSSIMNRDNRIKF